MSAAAEPVIAIRGLARSYPMGESVIHALRGVDLNIQRGGTGSGLWDVTNRKNYLLAPLAVSIPKRNSAH
jgi:hypothetical protein